MDDLTRKRLQSYAEASPFKELSAEQLQKQINESELAKLREFMPVEPPQSQQPTGPVVMYKRHGKKSPKAKRPSKDPKIHQYAERVRRMTDEQIWAEGHKAPTQAVVESVIRDIHEDLLSVLAPHFGDDIMKKIDEVLGNWYHVKSDHTFSGEVKEGGIDRPLTDDDRTKAGGVLGSD